MPHMKKWLKFISGPCSPVISTGAPTTTISRWWSQSMKYRLRKKSMWYTCTEKTSDVGQWFVVFVLSAVIGSETMNHTSGSVSSAIHALAITCSANHRAFVRRAYTTSHTPSAPTPSSPAHVTRQITSSVGRCIPKTPPNEKSDDGISRAVTDGMWPRTATTIISVVNHSALSPVIASELSSTPMRFTAGRRSAAATAASSRSPALMFFGRPLRNCGLSLDFCGDGIVFWPAGSPVDDEARCTVVMSWRACP